MKNISRILIVSVLAWTFTAHAEVIPSAGKEDARIRVVTYSPHNVIKINTFFGVSTHIQFGADEQIKDVAVGDDLAWKVVPRGNNIFIKPTAHEGDTNITVITNRRTYHFSANILQIDTKDKRAWANKELTYSLSFRYLDDEIRLADAKKKASDAKAARQIVKDELALVPQTLGHNMDYWAKGDESIIPTGAYDDGRFIYLSFNNNKDIPAVYEEDPKNGESLVNTHTISGNTVVVERLVSSLILRKGDSVARILNKSFDPQGGRENLTGTVSPSVERVVFEVD